MYFANPTGDPRVHAAIACDAIGYIDTPKQGNIRPAGVCWVADNGCFGEGFNESRWFEWLKRNAGDASRCVFATAPDVVGDAAATLERSTPWLPKIRALGYPAAYVAQDGIEYTKVPWDKFDCLFIGGTTGFKMGPHARQVARAAAYHGKWVHCGRINSGRRYRYWEAFADSCDGTYLTFGPSVNLPKLMRWVHQPSLFRLTGGAS